MSDLELIVMRSNPFRYSASSEKWWRDNIKALTSYKPITTFYNDLSIAECYGHKAIKDTYKRVLKEWGGNIKYMTEFVMCLNYKIWQLNDIDRNTAMLFDELWKQAGNYVEKHFKGNDLTYYYDTID